MGHLNIEASRAPFALDPGTHEYTWSFYGAVVHRMETPSPGIVYRCLTFGLFELREDPAFNAQYLADPPNELVPSAFHDGRVLLLGTVTDLRIRDIFGIVTATADLRFVGGSALGDLGSQDEWSFNAAVSTFGDEIPPGYGSRWALELEPLKPVSIQDASWGQIKALYR